MLHLLTIPAFAADPFEAWVATVRTSSPCGSTVSQLDLDAPLERWAVVGTEHGTELLIEDGDRWLRAQLPNPGGPPPCEKATNPGIAYALLGHSVQERYASRGDHLVVLWSSDASYGDESIVDHAAPRTLIPPGGSRRIPIGNATFGASILETGLLSLGVEVPVGWSMELLGSGDEGTTFTSKPDGSFVVRWLPQPEAWEADGSGAVWTSPGARLRVTPPVGPPVIVLLEEATEREIDGLPLGPPLAVGSADAPPGVPEARPEGVEPTAPADPAAETYAGDPCVHEMRWDAWPRPGGTWLVSGCTDRGCTRRTLPLGCEALQGTPPFAVGGAMFDPVTGTLTGPSGPIGVLPDLRAWTEAPETRVLQLGSTRLRVGQGELVFSGRSSVTVQGASGSLTVPHTELPFRVTVERQPSAGAPLVYDQWGSTEVPPKKPRPLRNGP